MLLSFIGGATCEGGTHIIEGRLAWPFGYNAIDDQKKVKVAWRALYTSEETKLAVTFA